MTHTKPLTENQTTIINLLQAQNWESVITVYAGLTKEQVLILLMKADPARNNKELLELIFREMPCRANAWCYQGWIPLVDSSNNNTHFGKTAVQAGQHNIGEPRCCVLKY